MEKIILKKLNGNNGKTKISTIALILMLTITATLVALPSVTAQQPTKEMYPYIGAIPNPVGVGQELLLHVGVTDQVDWIHGGWEGLTVTVTKPDGTTETLGPYTTDLTGGTGGLYIPTQIGTYTFVTNFPEQVVETPQRSIPEPNTLLFAASSPPLEVVVQAESLQFYPGFPQPDQYWTRPIDAQNREWNDIAGSWLDEPANLIAPYNDGPETAHILWATPHAMGGWVGGDMPHSMEIGDAYEGKFMGPIIINGILYYPNINTQGRGPLPLDTLETIAVDLHTGEELWSKPLLDLNNVTRSVSFGQTLFWDSFNNHGVYAYLWTTSGNTWNAYEAYTGDWAYTLTNVPSGSRYTGPNGEIYVITVNLEEGWVSQWNSTRAVNPQDRSASIDGSWGRYFGTETNRIIDASVNGIDWNVTIPTNFPGGLERGEPVQLVGDRVIIANLGGRSTFPGETVTVSAISIAPTRRGQLLYSTTWDSPAGWVDGNQVVEWMAWSAEDMVATLYAREKGENFGVSLETGELIWGPTTPPQNYLDSLDDTKSGARTIYNGKLYSASVSGIVYCWDVNTGEPVWSYEVDDPYSEILWANTWWARPLFITDGKIYVGSYEHSPIDPRPRGAPFTCLDAETGEVIWRADGLFRQTRWGGRAIIGDSIIATQDTYDQRVYAIGKGPSKTTLQIQTDIIPWGNSVMITGMVTDESPGTNDPALTMRFPNGVPAIADEYMSEWMLHVYKQYPLPDCVEGGGGVEVVLTTFDPNGNYYEIGRVTSSNTGMFKLMWAPPVPGEYTIMATFEGSEGYYGSYAETAIGVTEAPSPAMPIEPEPTTPEPTTPEPTTPEPTTPEPTTPEPTTPEPTEPEPTEAAEAAFITTEVAIIAAVIVASIIGVVSFWALRKRK